MSSYDRLRSPGSSGATSARAARHSLAHPRSAPADNSSSSAADAQASALGRGSATGLAPVPSGLPLLAEPPEPASLPAIGHRPSLSVDAPADGPAGAASSPRQPRPLGEPRNGRTGRRRSDGSMPPPSLLDAPAASSGPGGDGKPAANALASPSGAVARALRGGGLAARPRASDTGVLMARLRDRGAAGSDGGCPQAASARGMPAYRRSDVGLAGLTSMASLPEGLPSAPGATALPPLPSSSGSNGGAANSPGRALTVGQGARRGRGLPARDCGMKGPCHEGTGAVACTGCRGPMCWVGHCAARQPGLERAPADVCVAHSYAPQPGGWRCWPPIPRRARPGTRRAAACGRAPRPHGWARSSCPRGPPQASQVRSAAHAFRAQAGRPCTAGC